MVEVNGRPIVEHHLAWLRANGIERAFLLTGYMHEVIAEHFAAPRIEGLDVRCIAEASPLGRGGAYRNGYREAGLSDPMPSSPRTATCSRTSRSLRWSRRTSGQARWRPSCSLP